MSKRDDDSQADMDGGMTTAERRRRRRRGSGLRVPSDNVPRRSPTTPPVVAPIPEDPSLSMSIAYTFTSDASEPIPRTTIETPVPSFPVAPEAMPTVSDPQSGPAEQGDFETKTREMTAVDLEQLGLSDHAAPTSAPNIPVSPPPAAKLAPSEDLSSRASANALASRLGRPRLPSEPVLPIVAPPDANPTPPIIEVQPPKRPRAPTEPPLVPVTRVKTVSLSDSDLEGVHAGAASPPPRPTSNGAAKTAGAAPVAPSAASTQPGVAPAPAITPQDKAQLNKTQPLTALDVEVEDKQVESSAPEIDINDLSDRSDGSGEIDVDLDDQEPVQAVAQVASVTPPPPVPAPGSSAADRKRPPSVPPAIPMDAKTPSPDAKPAPVAAASTAHTPVPGTLHAHPPPTPAAHKAPPTPPKPKPPAAAPPAPTTKADAKRGRAWFVDLFDEDYLRTLPFLTPQATQGEAEFVIDSMGLQPGAQVLDVGCGYGRHAMELAARGFHVVGLDLSTPLLVRGGEEAMRRGLEINFVRGDMRELDFDAQFDAAYCLFSTFGYFDDETNKKTIANVARALKPGGRLLVEILNRDYVIADLPTRVWWEGDGCVVLEEVELNYFSSRIQVQRSVVFDDGRQLEQEISVRAYSLHEVGKLMHAAGFRVLEVSGGYQTRGRFFGNQSRHIIVLAERKELPAP